MFSWACRPSQTAHLLVLRPGWGVEGYKHQRLVFHWCLRHPREGGFDGSQLRSASVPVTQQQAAVKLSAGMRTYLVPSTGSSFPFGCPWTVRQAVGSPGTRRGHWGPHGSIHARRYLSDKALPQVACVRLLVLATCLPGSRETVCRNGVSDQWDPVKRVIVTPVV